MLMSPGGGVKKLSRKELAGIARDIIILILDVDGVLTDGGIIIDNEGNELKSFHVRDGHGIKMLGRAGIRVALITDSRKKGPGNGSFRGIPEVL